MKTFTFVVLLLIGASQTTNAQPPSRAGDVACKEGAEGCVITWNVTNTSKGFHQVQQFTAESNKWSDVGNVSTENYGEGNAPLSRGSLYRVKSCESAGSQSRCDYSNVHWALLKPEQADEIPEYIMDAQGQRLAVSKTGDLELQTDQYNVYRMIKAVEALQAAGKELPPMSKPRYTSPAGITDDGTLTNDDIYHMSVYRVYETLRAQSTEEAKD